jgi:catechol 2,3-dioxygenase
MLTDAGGHALVVLHEDRDAPPFEPSGNGLFHLALLVPDRRELARSLRRIASTGWPLTGASDHLVSEAVYLRDPDGNGIEIYRDRPRSQWPTDARGSIRMATLPLDLDDVLAELGADDHGDAPVAAGTRMGHVHLQVGQLDAAERFYCGVLGFEPTARGYPGALFASAGGYHHHIGLNTWQSLGAPPLAPGGVGLRSFEVLLPSTAALDRVLARVSAAGSACEPCDVAAGAMLVRDPFGIAIVLRSA